MNSKITFLIALLVSLVFFVLAGIYFVEPAKSLPSFLPGYNPLLARHHITHAVAAAGLGAVALAAGWMLTGKKSAKK